MAEQQDQVFELRDSWDQWIWVDGKPLGPSHGQDFIIDWDRYSDNGIRGQWSNWVWHSRGGRAGRGIGLGGSHYFYCTELMWEEAKRRSIEEDVFRCVLANRVKERMLLEELNHIALEQKMRQNMMNAVLFAEI